jgi:hypothetical protein
VISASGHLKIYNSLFERNDATAVYHGVSASIDYCQEVVIENTVFRGNSGMGLYSLNDWACAYTPENYIHPHVIIKDSLFDNHSTTAVVSRGGNLTVNNTRFVSNRGGYLPISEDCDSGDLYSSTGHDFNCSAGGAIMYDKYMMGYGQVVIKNSSFTNNMAPDFGGAVDVLGSVRCEESSYPRYSDNCNEQLANPDRVSAYDLVIKDSTFVGNNSHRGAAISVSRVALARSGFQLGNIKIEGSTFSKNRGVSNSPDGYIGNVEDFETSIIVTGGNAEISSTEFSDNSADAILKIKGMLDCDASCPN